ncbi:MAG: DUF4184 family protein [Promethearchaeota archaeon]
MSHQAPGLALKVKFPKIFDGSALLFGTFVPDLSLIISGITPINFYSLSHSLLGQILWSVPLGIILTLIFSRYIAPFYAKLAKRTGIFAKPLRYFGVDQWSYLKNKKFNIRFLVVAAYSVMIGGITHALLDWPSHEFVQLFYPWKVFPNPDFILYSLVDYGTMSVGPFLFEANLTIYNLLWFLETVITIPIFLLYLRYIKKHNLIRKWYEDYNN